MPEAPYLGETHEFILAHDFLTWLWYRADLATIFTDKSGATFIVSLEQRITVYGGEGANAEKVTASGRISSLREAFTGLQQGKKVSSAHLRIERDNLSWSTTLKASDLCACTVKTPSIDTAGQYAASSSERFTDAILFEKIYLLELFHGMLDSLFADFLTRRLSHQWQTETNDIRQWIQDSRT